MFKPPFTFIRYFATTPKKTAKTGLKHPSAFIKISEETTRKVLLDQKRSFNHQVEIINPVFNNPAIGRDNTGDMKSVISDYLTNPAPGLSVQIHFESADSRDGNKTQSMKVSAKPDKSFIEALRQQSMNNSILRQPISETIQLESIKDWSIPVRNQSALVMRGSKIQAYHAFARMTRPMLKEDLWKESGKAPSGNVINSLIGYSWNTLTESEKAEFARDL
jgi:hypothetical protein